MSRKGGTEAREGVVLRSQLTVIVACPPGPISGPASCSLFGLPSHRGMLVLGHRSGVQEVPDTRYKHALAMQYSLLCNINKMRPRTCVCVCTHADTLMNLWGSCAKQAVCVKLLYPCSALG